MKLNTIHVLIKFILFLIFLFVFGYPALETLLKKEVIIKESNEDYSVSPAFTICLVGFWGLMLIKSWINILRKKFQSDSTIKKKIEEIKFQNVSQFYSYIDSEAPSKEEMILGLNWLFQMKICTILAERVRHFVLLCYSHKFWSIFKARDIFEIC